MSLTKTNGVLVLALVGFCLPAGVRVSAQMQLYVDDNGPGDPAPGNTLSSDPAEDGSTLHPFDAIQEAIAAAEDGDEVIIRNGTYRGPGNLAIEFLGKAITVRSANGPDQVTIDCEGRGRGVYFRGGETASAVLEGITIRNGAAFGEDNFGAGIRCEMSSPTIRHCVITQCDALDVFCAGGGIHCNQSDPTISHCRIVDNSATGFFSRGGGVSLEASDPTISDCVIAGNRAGQTAGGIRCDIGSRPTLIRTSIQNNQAQFTGGFDIQSASHPVIQACRIVGNSSLISPGILVSESNADIHNSLVQGNITLDPKRGGIEVAGNSNANITHCTIVGNSVCGVSCFNPGGDTLIENCIIQGNGTDLLNCGATFSFTTNETPGEGNLNGDPMFVGPSDFHLQLGSPALDSGDPMFEPEPGESDLDGHARVICDATDMGAYERGIGDFNCDGEAELTDFSGWEDCQTGPDAGPLGPECNAFDFDADGDVDIADFNKFAESIAQ